jgi:hypothetical protein
MHTRKEEEATNYIVAKACDSCASGLNCSCVEIEKIEHLLHLQKPKKGVENSLGTSFDS